MMKNPTNEEELMQYEPDVENPDAESSNEAENNNVESSNEAESNDIESSNEAENNNVESSNEAENNNVESSNEAENNDAESSNEAENNDVESSTVDETTCEEELVNEEIVFQRIMDYKAYRRGMVLTRVLITAGAAIALAFVIRFNIVLGLLLPVAAVIVGAISILVSMGNERNYNIYNTRIVIKRRGDDTRKSVPLDSVVAVKYKSAFYEKRLCIGTVTVSAKNAKGKIKKYKLKHIFDAQPVVQYLMSVIDGRSTTDADENRE